MGVNRSLVALFDELIAELRAKATNAARRNKPTMWAYYSDVADALLDCMDDVRREDGDYSTELCDLVDHAAAKAPELPPTDAARLWASGIYARRVLRRWGLSMQRPSLDWLRERAA